SGIDFISRVDHSELAASAAAEVKDFDPTNFMEKKDARKMDLFTQYAVAAARMAVDDASLTIDENNADRVGVWVGSGIGCLTSLENMHTILLEICAHRISPCFVPMMIPDMSAGQVSILLGAKGINSCTTTSCASGAN